MEWNSRPAPLRAIIACIPRVILIIAGLAFVATSAVVNARYGLASSDDGTLRAAWAGLALAVSAAAALLIPSAHAALQNREYGRALTCIAGAALFAGYSLTCALGAASGGRADASHTAHETAQRRDRAQASYERAIAELATLQPARPSAEIASIVTDKRLNDCIGWLETTRARTKCVDVSLLRAELGRANRREGLEKDRDTAKTVLDGTLHTPAANADATSLAGVLAVFGVRAEPSDVNLWLSVLKAVLIEIGGGVCFTAAAIRSHAADAPNLTVQTREPMPGTREGDTSERPLETPVRVTDAMADAGRESSNSTHESLSAVQVQIIAAVCDRPGISQRELAAVIGTSQTTVSRQMRALAGSGHVVRQVDGYQLAALAKWIVH